MMQYFIILYKYTLIQYVIKNLQNLDLFNKRPKVIFIHETNPDPPVVTIAS